MPGSAPRIERLVPVPQMSPAGFTVFSVQAALGARMCRVMDMIMRLVRLGSPARELIMRTG